MDNGANSYRRFLDGDENAFDDIINEYKENLIFFIERYVHDMSAAEDIAIDVFADLLVHKSRYNFKVQLKTYMFKIGRSKALNYIKHRDKFRMVEYEDAESELIYRENVEDAVLIDETKRIVNEAIDKIPKDMREFKAEVYRRGKEKLNKKKVLHRKFATYIYIGVVAACCAIIVWVYSPIQIMENKDLSKKEDKYIHASESENIKGMENHKNNSLLNNTMVVEVTSTNGVCSTYNISNVDKIYSFMDFIDEIKNEGLENSDSDDLGNGDKYILTLIRDKEEEKYILEDNVLIVSDTKKEYKLNKKQLEKIYNIIN